MRARHASDAPSEKLQSESLSYGPAASVVGPSCCPVRSLEIDPDKYLDQITGTTQLRSRGSRTTLVLLIAAVAIVAVLAWVAFR